MQNRWSLHRDSRKLEETRDFSKKEDSTKGAHTRRAGNTVYFAILSRYQEKHSRNTDGRPARRRRDRIISAMLWSLFFFRQVKFFSMFHVVPIKAVRNFGEVALLKIVDCWP